MKLGRNLTAAALILALHAGLLVVIVTLSPPTQRAATQPAPALLSTVMVLLAPLLPQPAPQKQPALKSQVPQTSALAQSRPTPSALAGLAPQLPTMGTATAITLPAAPEAAEVSAAPAAPLRIGIGTMQSAAREADNNSVRRLALQSGKIDELETTTPNPIALVAAESSVPPCPPKGQLRETVGPQGYALTRDRSGDCDRERKAKVRARALGR
ncbi:MAG: hypothetical protein H7293_02550 [Candidatus Saccharibacteria bacterium]|nr:hypothetical protein [Rhodoferax sp.]